MNGISDRESFVIGAKQVIKAIKSEEVLKIYVASDCDSDISKPVTELAQKNNLPLFYVSTRKELGRMFGIDVKAACAAQTL